jgi:hypothetical protein
MRYKRPLAFLVVLSLAGGAWYLVRARISATALAGTSHDIPKPHQNKPPHGGTPIGLGDDQFNVELVRDPATGTLKAFVLDGEMEDFIRISAKVLVIDVEHEGRKDTLRLLPVADAATGEKVGNTCLFQTQADWLKLEGHFKGVIPSLAIQDQKFQAVSFKFPEGNEKE